MTVDDAKRKTIVLRKGEAYTARPGGKTKL